MWYLDVSWGELYWFGCDWCVVGALGVDVLVWMWWVCYRGIGVDVLVWMWWVCCRGIGVDVLVWVCCRGIVGWMYWFGCDGCVVGILWDEWCYLGLRTVKTHPYWNMMIWVRWGAMSRGSLAWNSSSFIFDRGWLSHYLVSKVLIRSSGQRFYRSA